MSFSKKANKEYESQVVDVGVGIYWESTLCFLIGSLK